MDYELQRQSLLWDERVKDGAFSLGPTVRANFKRKQKELGRQMDEKVKNEKYEK